MSDANAPTESDLVALFADEAPAVKLKAWRLATQPARLRAWAVVLGVVLSAGTLALMVAILRALKLLP